jgi:hypothetical protein
MHTESSSPIESTPPTQASAPETGTPPEPPSDAAPPIKRPRSGLTAIQELALEHITSGVSIADAARAARVDRRTLHRWIRDDARFAAAYNAWRREVVDSGRARVLAMSNRALDAMNAAIEKGDTRVALQVAKASGALDAQKPGLTDADTLRRKRKLRDGQREIKLEEAENRYQRAIGEDSRQTLKHLELLEPHIDLLLKLRQALLRDETPDERAKRLALIAEKAWAFDATADIFALADAKCPAKPRLWMQQALDAPASLPSPTPAPAESTTTDSSPASAIATPDTSPIAPPPPSDPPHSPAEPAAFKLPPCAAPTPPSLAPAPAPPVTKALVTRARARPYNPDAPDPSDKFFGYEPR